MRSKPESNRDRPEPRAADVCGGAVSRVDASDNDGSRAKMHKNLMLNALKMMHGHLAEVVL